MYIFMVTLTPDIASTSRFPRNFFLTRLFNNYYTTVLVNKIVRVILGLLHFRSPTSLTNFVKGFPRELYNL